MRIAFSAQRIRIDMGTISKALALLNHFSRSRPEIGLGEFVRLSGRDKATVHRHLGELLANGFLEQHPVTRAYRLGPAVLRLSGVREATHPVRAAIRPIVIDMATDLGELVHVSLTQGEALSPVFHFDPAVYGTQVHFDEAEMLPLHATSSGLAVLAFSDASELQGLLARELATYTDQTITDPQALRDALASVRRSGISALSGAFDNEVSSQGAPVFDVDAVVVGAVSVAIPSVRVDQEKQRQCEVALREGVYRITEAIGGRVPDRYTHLWQSPRASMHAVV